MSKSILVTGGAGFIGSALIRHMVVKYPQYRIVNLDKLTYAGNLENLISVEKAPNYSFVKGDILDEKLLQDLFTNHAFDTVIHLAAESHVDRSIHRPDEFAMTNIIGTIRMLNAAKKAWAADVSSKIFYHISTDEVYGSIAHGFFTEETPMDPRSPYSSSKAGSDHFVMAYANSYKLPVLLSRCSNNYGPYQFPEKLIPLMINNIIQRKPLPVYGKGENVRDWLYVDDHAKAIDTILHNGNTGEVYNIGGNNEWKNIDIVKRLCRVMDEKLNRTPGESESLVTFVQDRPGHDLRYAIDATKVKQHTGWIPETTFEEGLEKTVDWYLANATWLAHVTSGDYQKYYDNMYTTRLKIK